MFKHKISIFCAFFAHFSSIFIITQIKIWRKWANVSVMVEKARMINKKIFIKCLNNERVLCYNQMALEKRITEYMMESYSRGRRGAPAKGVGVEMHARVQIPHSPPKNDWTCSNLFLCEKM